MVGVWSSLFCKLVLWFRDRHIPLLHFLKALENTAVLRFRQFPFTYTCGYSREIDKIERNATVACIFSDWDMTHL